MPRLEVTIAELAPGGEGVAICSLRGEDRAVFVAGVLPGERVEVDVDPSRRPARGTLIRVVEPSAERTAAPCADAARCGGCDWMHLSPRAQAAEHARIVGKLLGVAVKAHDAPAPLAYRTRARVHVESTKKGGLVVGMFARGSHAATPVATCVVLDPILDRARGALGTWLDGASGRGEAQLSLGRPGAERRAVLDLRWRGEIPGPVFGRLERAVNDGALAGARVFAGEVKVPATIGDPTPWIAGADGEALVLAPGGFGQATERGNVLLAARASELARSLAGSSKGTSIELYAGAGNLTVLLARGLADDHELVAVESDRDACAAARVNLAARGLAKRVRVVEGDAATYPLPKNVRSLVLDPPREGARAVAEAIAAGRQRPPIVYVSCDPATLARDVKILARGGYAIASAETFEMFPQTSHVETVVSLVTS